MKLPITIISMVALSAALTLTQRAAEENLVAECGDLGVMTVDPADLPVGVAPSDVRKCLDHPLGRNRPVKGASLAPLDDVDDSFYDDMVDEDTSPVETRADGLGALRERGCKKEAPYGCAGGYCWKACGNMNIGEWCWTAKKGGIGGWIQCTRWQDCGTKTYACGKGGCLSCGCSC